MRVAIMGAGSLGTIIGAFISEHMDQIELIDVNEEHVQALNKSGATIIGTIEKTIPVRAITPDQMEGIYDVIFLLTKQYFNNEVLTNLKNYMNEESIVCSLQNGVPEESIADIVGKERVIAGSVEFGATYQKPGVSELTSDYNEVKKFAFMIGELNGETTERVKTVKQILYYVGNTVITDNLVGTKWSKLVINASMSGLSAALNCTFGDILNDEKLLEYAIRIIDETVKVGHSKNVKFVPIFGLDFNKFIIDENNVNEKMKQFKKILLSHSRLKASMLQDLEKGKQTEIMFINGEIADTTDPSNTPFNSLIVQLVKEAEKNKTTPIFEVNKKKLIKLVDLPY